MRACNGGALRSPCAAVKKMMNVESARMKGVNDIVGDEIRGFLNSDMLS